MSTKAVVVKIKPDGSIVVEAEGYSGPACADAVRKYTEALGVAVSEEHLPEFYVEQGADEEDSVTLGGSW